MTRSGWFWSRGTTVGRQIFQASKQTYGSRRVVRELEKAGYNVGRYQVRSLIRRLGLRAKTPRRYKVTTDSNHRILVYCR
jgi:putative transposase